MKYGGFSLKLPNALATHTFTCYSYTGVAPMAPPAVYSLTLAVPGLAQTGFSLWPPQSPSAVSLSEHVLGYREMMLGCSIPPFPSTGSTSCWCHPLWYCSWGLWWGHKWAPPPQSWLLEDFCPPPLIPMLRNHPCLRTHYQFQCLPCWAPMPLCSPPCHWGCLLLLCYYIWCCFNWLWQLGCTTATPEICKITPCSTDLSICRICHSISGVTLMFQHVNKHQDLSSLSWLVQLNILVNHLAKKAPGLLAGDMWCLQTGPHTITSDPPSKII